MFSTVVPMGKLPLNYIKWLLSIIRYYPLVITLSMLKAHHVGFYYDYFDAYDGERQLINAIKTYDAD